MLRRSFVNTFCRVLLGFFLHAGMRSAIVWSADIPASPRLRWTLRREEDRIVMQGDASATRLSIHSPSGIGRATIERIGSDWPAQVLLRLQLKGLELLRLTAGETVVGASIGFSEGRLTQRGWRGESDEQELPKDDPLRLHVHPLDAHNRPAVQLPLEEGVFEVEVPQAMLRGNPVSFTVEWIDFYRG